MSKKTWSKELMREKINDRYTSFSVLKEMDDKIFECCLHEGRVNVPANISVFMAKGGLITWDHFSICFSVWLSFCLSIRSSVCLSVYPSTCLSVRYPVRLSVRPLVFPSIRPPVCLFFRLSVRPLSCPSVFCTFWAGLRHQGTHAFLGALLLRISSHFSLLKYIGNGAAALYKPVWV